MEWTPCKFRTLHLVAILLSLSSISNSWLPTPCVAVKSSYTPGFFPLITRTNFLSRGSRCVFSFSRRVTRFLNTVLRLVLQRTFVLHNFSQSALGFTRKVIGRFEHRMWSDWLTYFMDPSAILKLVLISQRCFARLWFLFLRFFFLCCGCFSSLFRQGHETWCTL